MLLRPNKLLVSIVPTPFKLALRSYQRQKWITPAKILEQFPLKIAKTTYYEYSKD